MKQTEELTKKSIDQKIVEVLRSVLGRKKHSLHTPVFDGKENQYLKNV